MLNNLKPTQFPAFNTGLLPDDLWGTAINWCVNSHPLTSRLPKLPIATSDFLLDNSLYRPKSTSLQVECVLYATDETAFVYDSRIFSVGDVVQIDQEYCLILRIDYDRNMLILVRGYGGTLAVIHKRNSPVYIVGGPRIEATPLNSFKQLVTQHCEYLRWCYRFKESPESIKEDMDLYQIPLDFNRYRAMINIMDSFETSCYTGCEESLNPNNEKTMKGLCRILATNNTIRPINAESYGPGDLVRDTLKACFDGGGNPNILLVSRDFMNAFAIWGHAAMRVDAGQNVFGQPIELYEVPFMSGISIIRAPLLPLGTVVCLSSHEVRIRIKRKMVDRKEKKEDGFTEGSISMEGAIEVENESHHSWTTGITSFSAK